MGGSHHTSLQTLRELTPISASPGWYWELGLWRTYRQRVLTAAGRVPQTRAKTRTGSQSDLPHRRVVPVQSVHQLHREPISAVGKEKGS